MSFCRQGFTGWLKKHKHDKSLAGAFKSWLQDIGEYNGEIFTNIVDLYPKQSEPEKQSEDRYGGFPPLIGDL